MPFTAEEITELGYSSLNYYLKNNPIDQIAQQRPLLKRLMAGKKSFPGGNDSIVEQIRKSYDSGMQWFQGADEVTYNTKNTLDQVKFPWKGCHDGFSMSEDYLLSNGITVTDSGTPSTNSRGERLRLTNLFKEAMETLRLGFEEALDQNLHETSTVPEVIDGLESLVSLDPTNVIGGIDRNVAGNEYWKNHVALAIAQAEMINTMEGLWRKCIINGGAPDFIIAGANFVDMFRNAAKGEISRYMVQQTIAATPGEYDPSTKQSNGATFTGLHFQGVPIMYDPTFEVLDAMPGAPTEEWTNRCYFLNMKHMKLRPAEGHDMIPRKPPRAYSTYVHRWGMTWKGGLCINRSNCHAVMLVTPTAAQLSSGAQLTADALGEANG